MKAIPFAAIPFVDSEGCLACPSCYGYFLHHESVEVWDRDEDDERGVHALLDNRKLSVDQEMAGNPSERRHGLAIYFWCETCPGQFALTVSQHKGNTFVAWHDAAELRKLKQEDEARKLAKREKENAEADAINTEAINQIVSMWREANG